MQNRINDKNDWAPRVSLAYALGKHGGSQQPKTVLRAGYGWFYQRFEVPNSFGSTQGTPYIIQAIHNNFVPLGSTEIPNQQTYIIQNPNFYQSQRAGHEFLRISRLPRRPRDTRSTRTSTPRTICRARWESIGN